MRSNNAPSLSVITVSAFDTLRLRSTLESLGGNLVDFEFVLVCPESDHSSAEVFNTFLAKDFYPMRMVHDEGSGIYPAMNVGLKYCSGTYVIFWNSGDSAKGISELQEFIEFLKLTNFDWGVTQADFTWRPSQELTENNVRKFVLQQGGYVSHQSVFAKKDIVLELGAFDSKMKVAGDVLLITKLWLSYKYGFYAKSIVGVEFPSFSARMHRRGRVENLKIALLVLPIRFKLVTLQRICRREMLYSIKKSQRFLKQMRLLK